MAPAIPSARRLLEDTHLRAILQDLHTLEGPSDAPPKPPDMIKFTTKTHVGEALKTLAAYNILSAPVTDPSTQGYVGMLDVMDILGSFVGAVYPELLREGWMEVHKKLSVMELESLGVEFSARSIQGILHGGELWYKGDSESSLLDVVETGFRIGLPPRVHSPRHHLRVHHRIAVFDILPGEQTPDGPIPEWRITSVVSQMDILRFLAANMASLVDQEEEANARADKFGCAGTVASMHASLQELGLVHGAAAVVTVTAFTPTLVVLATVHKAKLSGVGIVASNDQNAPLLATLSASDVRGLTPDRFGALSLPVGAFLLLMHPESTPPGGPRSNKVTWEDALLGQFPPPVAEGRWEDALAGLRSQTVRCAPEASLREAVELMVRGGKHRVYVCDATGRAVGVVTPTDVLRLVVE